MDYYIAWTHSDPIYQHYLPGTRVLVSPPNVNSVWDIYRWPVLPKDLIIDSGAFQYNRSGRPVAPEAALERQVQMASDAPISIGMCHLDVPMMGTRSVAELDRRVDQNLANAQWLIDRASSFGLHPNIHLVGVIQGYSVERIYVVAQALADMGYTWFALGSLAGMVASAKAELFRRVEAALEAIGTNIHVLGVSSAKVLTDLARLGIASADSGAPIHEAWRGGLFYSNPFRRYKLPSPHMKEWSRSYSFADILAEPLPCDCPICREDSQRLMVPSGKAFVNLRAIHNCYHLIRELGVAL